MSERNKRFIIFSYEAYYPYGGLDDLEDQSFDSLDDAANEVKFLLRQSRSEYFQIYDRITGLKVWEVYRGYEEGIKVTKKPFEIWLELIERPDCYYGADTHAQEAFFDLWEYLTGEKVDFEVIERAQWGKSDEQQR